MTQVFLGIEKNFAKVSNHLKPDSNRAPSLTGEGIGRLKSFIPHYPHTLTVCFFSAYYQITIFLHCSAYAAYAQCFAHFLLQAHTQCAPESVRYAEPRMLS